MSYEGYDQVLCANGHYFTYDCYDFWESEGWQCPICNAAAVWSNMVDVTNGSYEYDEWDTEHRIDGYVELELLDECKCEYCGSILEQRYKIPERKTP